MRKRHVWNCLYFGHSEYAKIRLPSMKSIPGIMIRTEVFRQTLSANRSTEHPAQRHTVNGAAVDGKAHDAKGILVHHEENPIGSQGCGFAAEQIAAPQTVLHVAEKGESGWTVRVWVRLVMRAQDTANHVFINLDAESQRDLLGNAGTAPVGITSFHCHDDIDEFFFFGPFGPGRAARWDENNMRYFRFLSTLWRYSRVAGPRTMPERRRRDGRMKKVHRPSIMRSAGRRLGARLRPRLRIRS